MKKSTTRRLLLLCLCLTLVTVSLIGGTLARYTTTVVGSGTMTAATWDMDVKINSVEATTTTETFTLPTAKMYPGMDTITIPVNVSNGSDTVDAEYTVTAQVTSTDSSVTLPTGMTATIGGTDCKATSATSAVVTLAKSANVTTNLVITWPYGADVNDTAFQGKTITVTISVTGYQTTGRPTT